MQNIYAYTFVIYVTSTIPVALGYHNITCINFLNNRYSNLVTKPSMTTESLVVKVTIVSTGSTEDC